MAMTNFRDLSTTATEVGAGFQFEFFCEITGDTWRSPFQPYRRGQFVGMISRMTLYFNQLHGLSRASGHAADAGVRKAKADALAEAQALALKRFHQCPKCHKWAGLAAWDDARELCTGCAGRGSGGSGGGYAGDDGGHEAEARGGVVCPNCQTPSEGGRFCHECGFDMASAFKSCPACGVTQPRQARFCTDCGHGF